MLVLTRRNNEAIILGDDIKITILEIDSDRVKIGIEAPQARKILRAELLAEVRSVNREAIQTNLSFMKSIIEPVVAAPANTNVENDQNLHQTVKKD